MANVLLSCTGELTKFCKQEHRPSAACMKNKHHVSVQRTAIKHTREAMDAIEILSNHNQR